MMDGDECARPAHSTGKAEANDDDVLSSSTPSSSASSSSSSSPPSTSTTPSSCALHITLTLKLLSKQADITHSAFRRLTRPNLFYPTLSIQRRNLVAGSPVLLNIIHHRTFSFLRLCTTCILSYSYPFCHSCTQQFTHLFIYYPPLPPTHSPTSDPSLVSIRACQSTGGSDITVMSSSIMVRYG